jgi:AbiV family abortive infection protein
MAKTPNLASRGQLIAGARAALQNAGRLVKDAGILLAAGSAPTAYSIAVLAIEEASKAFSWLDGATASDGQAQVEVPTEVAHANKLARAHAFLVLARDLLDDGAQLTDAEILDRAEQLAKDDNVAKQRGFYVDLENGLIKAPSDIGAAEAAEIIEIAEAVIGMAVVGAIYLSTRPADSSGG